MKGINKGNNDYADHADHADYADHSQSHSTLVAARGRIRVIREMRVIEVQPLMLTRRNVLTGARSSPCSTRRIVTCIDAFIVGP